MSRLSASQDPIFVPLAEHPHNLDPTARLVFEDRVCFDQVYAVRAGFVAVPGALGVGIAFSETFPSILAARAALLRVAASAGRA